MKKLFALLLILALALSLVACGNAGDQPSINPTQDSSQDQEEPDPTEGEDAEPSGSENPVEGDDPIKSGRYTLPSGFNINFSSSVRNDVTGNWRLSTTSDSSVPAEYAVEYYETMFSSDDEIHAIWNATLGTTTRISVMGGMLFVDTLEYVDGEEHDAKLLFSGDLLDSKIIVIETGELLED